MKMQAKPTTTRLALAAVYAQACGPGPNQRNGGAAGTGGSAGTGGAGDGVCDACSIAPGVTTEDELFVLMPWVAAARASPVKSLVRTGTHSTA